MEPDNSADPMQEHKSVIAEWDLRKLTSALSMPQTHAPLMQPPAPIAETEEWVRRARLAEAKLADLRNLLAEYREGMRQYPLYAELAAIVYAD